MANRKLYTLTTDEYERKLARVMERLGVSTFRFNWDRWKASVDFQYKGPWYRFEHDVEKARNRGLKLDYGSDAFAQIVLSLEDLARMVERGIYELSVWVEGMRHLPPAKEIPDYFKTLGFTDIPDSAGQVLDAYRIVVKAVHPDVGGTDAQFRTVTDAKDQALKYFEDKGARV